MSSRESLKELDPWGYYNGIALRWLTVALGGVFGMTATVILPNKIDSLNNWWFIFFLISLMVALVSGSFVTRYLVKRDETGKPSS